MTTPILVEPQVLSVTVSPQAAVTVLVAPDGVLPGPQLVTGRGDAVLAYSAGLLSSVTYADGSVITLSYALGVLTVHDSATDQTTTIPMWW